MACTAFGSLPVAARLGPLLDDAAASGWRERESALATACEVLLGIQREQGQPAPAAAVIPFFDRPYRTVDQTAALAEAELGFDRPEHGDVRGHRPEHQLPGLFVSRSRGDDPPEVEPPVTVVCMPPRSQRRPLGLFDNPVADFSLEELAQAVRMLEHEQPGRTVDELSRAVFAELAVKRTQRAAELVAEAIRLARARGCRAEITGSPWQASTQEVRDWARRAGFEAGGDGSIPEQAIVAYNQTHPGRPY